MSLLRGALNTFLDIAGGMLGHALVLLALLVLGGVLFFGWEDWTLVNLSIIAATLGVLALGCALVWRSMR
ncbi:hypothetical protein GCM10007301_27120 [Azorhizobium oxalatiphilum]|uniref:Uncharacterized protein n=1 Tax=Azorhizobium oxalatiphilum TaxID=980631 RepID=A0A917C1D3_9HYPH|nr:hypothetical protein [Azorhizobium oxalatiphilum]GGF66000.1 hypothetical protein GCM10007301_27120 [Azorhizobium oxalatiphilum]